MLRGKCPDTGKTMYADRRDARTALNALIARRAGAKSERCAYSCKFCGKWHLTSMGEKPTPIKTTRLPPARRWRWNGKLQDE